MKSCETCEYVGVVVVPVGAATEEGQPPETAEVPVCRCNPPTVSLIPTQNGPQAITVWPQIAPKLDFCGSHVDRRG